MPDYQPLNWDQMYSDGIAPWDDPAPWPPLRTLVEANCKPGGSILEVGCGYGSDAVHLAELGYRVTATDLSETAISRAQEMAGDADVDFRVEDFFNHADSSLYDVIFEKGVMLNVGALEDRLRFARVVRERLQPDGRWISVIGNLDNLNRDETGPDKRGFPRMSLLETAAAIEPDFEIQSVTLEQFGSLADNSFTAWVVVSRPRRLPIEQVLEGLPPRNQSE